MMDSHSSATQCLTQLECSVVNLASYLFVSCIDIVLLLLCIYIIVLVHTVNHHMLQPVI